MLFNQVFEKLLQSAEIQGAYFIFCASDWGGKKREIHIRKSHLALDMRY